MPARLRLPAGLRQALAAPLLLAVAAQNLGNLLLHALLGRSLGPESYGELGTLLALLTLVTVPLAALQTAASAAAVTSGRARGDGRRLAAVGAWAAGATALCLAAAPAAISAFHLTSTFDALLLGPFVGISIVLAVVRGRLLGHRRVGVVALTFVVSIGVRLLLTVALLPWGITGALLATLIGEAAALLLGAIVVFRAPWVQAVSRPWLTGGDLARNAIALTGLFLFTTIDLFLARALLDPASAGGYVAAATIGKTLLALPAAALSAAYPRLVKVGTGPGRRGELLRSGGVVVGTALLAAAAVAAVPGLVVSLMYGEAFAGTESVVRVLALVAGSSALVSLMTYAQMAVRSPLAYLPWLGAALEVGLIAAAHDSSLAVARGAAVALVVTVLAMGLPLLRSILSTARAHAASQPQGELVKVPA
jgi:O-antigen/teichoic acid export membrane protein